MNQRCILQRWYTYKSKYLREFETEFENILGCESKAHMGSIIEKNQRSIISCYCTFKFGLNAMKKNSLLDEICVCRILIPLYNDRVPISNNVLSASCTVSRFCFAHFHLWGPNSKFPPFRFYQNNFDVC